MKSEDSLNTIKNELWEISLALHHKRENEVLYRDDPKKLRNILVTLIHEIAIEPNETVRLEKANMAEQLIPDAHSLSEGLR
jgi:hypothetical protein